MEILEKVYSTHEETEDQKKIHLRFLATQIKSLYSLVLCLLFHFYSFSGSSWRRSPHSMGFETTYLLYDSVVFPGASFIQPTNFLLSICYVPDTILGSGILLV